MGTTGWWLSEADRVRVHRESVRILSEVGVRFHGERALPLLDKAGARVDRDASIARIPEAMVDEALSAAPKEIVLGARDPAFDFAMPAPATRYASDGTASFAIDFATGERRYGMRQDIEDSLRIIQSLDRAVMAWPTTCASDAPAHSRALHEFLAMARATAKHGEHELHSAAQVPYLEAALVAILGSEAEVRARHAYSLIYCPVAPLTHDGEMLDGYLELGRLDMPVAIMPMPVTGTTGPATLFANVCVANAEALSSIVVYQLAHPGRPVIYANATGTMDFRSGAFLGGTPEMGLMSAALTSMARHYGLPCMSAGCTADAREPGPQAVLEKLATTITPVMAGVDIFVGTGVIESDQTLVLEQLLVDDQIAAVCERLAAGIDPGDGLFADIAEVGPGGNFLAQRSTRSAARSGEFLPGGLTPRQSYETWVELGRPTLYDNARTRVTEILAGPHVGRLPDATLRELDDILAAADRELADAGTEGGDR
jgi:trimethylamine--corrinoid protein Co-methyltransferase